MNTLCYAKKTCSIGIHILLEEIGDPYELKILDFSKTEQKTTEYKAINPKGKVPALIRDDGSVLTEFAAIATWLAMSYPNKHLIPKDTEGMVRTIEALDFIVGTVHMLSWRLWRRPDAYVDDSEGQEKLRARGKIATLEALQLVSDQLLEKEYLVNGFSIADAALYYTEFWVVDVAGWKLPENLNGHYERMKDRSSVQASRKLEGLI